jgi:hypothetical protein
MKKIRFAPTELVDAGIEVIFRPGRGCDFCVNGTPTVRYPARNADLGTIVRGTMIHSAMVLKPIALGDWRACADCAELIEAGNWPALARHTLRTLNLDLSKAGPWTRVELLAMIHASHRAFQTAKSGPGVAV